MQILMRPIYTKKEQTHIKIQGIPIMKTRTNQLITIPIQHDMPTIGICGMKRTGKSIIGHHIIHMFHYAGDYSIIIANDRHEETHYWSSPQKHELFLKQNHELGLQPAPLPIIHAHPKKPATTPDKNHDNIHPRITLTEALTSQDMRTTKATSATARHINRIKKELQKCTTYQEANKLIETTSLPKNIIHSIQKEIDSIQAANIATTTPQTYTIRTPQGTLQNQDWIDAALKTRNIISLMTRPLWSDEIYRAPLIRLILEKIINKQQQPYYRQKKGMIIFFDELQGIDSIYKRTAATPTIRKLVTEGGPQRIAMIWSSQNPSVINREIWTNTKYCITMRLNQEETKSITRQFGLEKNHEETINHLKKFECCLITTENVNIYDLRTGKSKVYDGHTGFFVGQILYPPSRHDPPDSKPINTPIKSATKHIHQENITIQQDGKTIIGNATKKILATPEGHPQPTKYDTVNKTQPTEADGEYQQITYEETKNLGYKIITIGKTKTNKNIYALTPITEKTRPEEKKKEITHTNEIEYAYHPQLHAIRIEETDHQKAKVWCEHTQKTEAFTRWQPIA